MQTYVTVSGQTWDQIAKDVYGEERYCDRIMDANRDLLEYFVFPTGIALDIPDKAEVITGEVPSDFPTWRAQLDGR